jgi:hypothetical protein
MFWASSVHLQQAQINKEKFPIPYEQLYIQSHHHHKQLIPEQNSGEYNLMYQPVYDQQVLPHSTKPPTHTSKPNKPVDPQLATSQQLQLHATRNKNC